ncbi:MAG TPA: type VI secretion system contractile sheath large subunit [Gammaproteobacteria bacterium]|jgi:type VI secretion system protein ImpC|nr:type VI secretion system contractile sheath large subunit [Gammaproteobacteria bacterium]
MSEMKKEGQTAEAAEGSLLDQIMQETRLKPSEEGYEIAKKGVEAFISELLQPQRKTEKVEQKLVDEMIAEIDRKLSKQVDEILHNADFQKLESSWRGLKSLVDRTDFRENTKLEMLSVAKEELLQDFEDAPEVAKSGLYKHVYTAEFGQFGGAPYGAMIGAYDFGPGAQDIQLLRNIASVSAMSHAPFVAAAAPQFFGVDSYEELAAIKDMQATFEGPQYAKWRAFRESDDSRNVGLTAPRFMLRAPYGENNKAREFNYVESVKGHNDYLWGNTAFSFASRLSDSFKQYRWCPNVIGPQSGGMVDNLPVHTYQDKGETKTKPPVEALISDRREFELAEQGFIPLVAKKDSDHAVFFSANSVQKAKSFGNSAEGKEAEMNFRLGTQLPYLLIVNRLAHYLKVLQREHIGSWKTRNDLDRELNAWIRQYVADQDNPPASVRSRRPLREAKVTVSDIEGQAGWYKVELSVRPHFKYMGAAFTLSLVGKLEKEGGGGGDEGGGDAGGDDAGGDAGGGDAGGDAPA